MTRETRYRLLVLIVLLFATFCIWVAVWERESRAPGNLRVVFFDVGQGDAIFVESPVGVQMLIDGGATPAVLRRLSRELGFFDRTLDVVVATHADTDHIGGLVDVLARYQVATIVRTENSGESQAADTFTRDAETEGAEIVYARRGMEVDLGGGAVLTILFPDRDPSFLESNTSSIVARLTYGESEFLFTGDSPQGIEEHLAVLDTESLRSDVLKVGHHGSRTSTSPLFLDAVAPEFAVISAGRDNRYGHPHEEVLEALGAEGVGVLNTASEGSIVFESNGVSLWRKE